MNKKFVEAFEAGKGALREQFAAKHPANYAELVGAVIRVLTQNLEDYARRPDPERIVEIDHGDYQGVLLYVIGETEYQPSLYWYVFVDYGSCSGCDTLEAIREYGDDPPTKEQVDDYMTLALHVVQRLKPLTPLDDADEL